MTNRRLLSAGMAVCLLGAGLVEGAEPAKATNAKAKVAQSWPQFLGPARNGISPETGLLKSIPADGPTEVWRVPGGVGMAGLVIDEGRLVTMVQRDGKQLALVLDAASGKTQHEITIATAFQNPMGNGPRATPAIAGDMAWVYTGEGVLAAVDVAKGKVVWSRDVLQELDGNPPEYGASSSPLLAGDLVVVIAGASKGTVAAYDRVTGEPAWKTVAGGGDTAGYSSPALRKAGGIEQVVAFEGKAAIGLSPKSGDLLWRFPYTTDFDCNIATPLEHDGQVFISSGENHGSALLELKKDGAKLAAKPVWESHGPDSVMRNEWQTSILLDGYLYGMDNVGGAGPITHLNCVDIRKGKLVWQQKRFGKGNLIAADGKLWISTIKGELALVRATPDKFEELGRAAVIGMTRQAPALANGLLYLRDDREIVCFDVRAK